MPEFDLDKAVRKIPDFPKKGILFYDITSIITNPKAFRYIVKKMIDTYKDKKISRIICIESRGFIFGAPLAYELDIPLILARKKGKLPGKTISEEYSLEYGTDSIEVHVEDLPAGENILVIDDLIATGGTIEAVCKIIEKQESTVSGIFAVIDLPFLNNKAKLDKYDVTTLIAYDSE